MYWKGGNKVIKGETIQNSTFDDDMAYSPYT